jgi:hypothetical protein
MVGVGSQDDTIHASAAETMAGPRSEEANSTSALASVSVLALPSSSTHT